MYRGNHVPDGNRWDPGKFCEIREAMHLLSQDQEHHWMCRFRRSMGINAAETDAHSMKCRLALWRTGYEFELELFKSHGVHVVLLLFDLCKTITANVIDGKNALITSPLPSIVIDYLGLTDLQAIATCIGQGDPYRHAMTTLKAPPRAPMLAYDADGDILM